jgi:hypothetical protein
MHLGKLKNKWIIRCKVKNSERGFGKKYFPLSFTISDYLQFIPPDGSLKDFHLRGKIHDSHIKVKPGIYKNSHACVWVRESPQGTHLHAFSHKLDKLQEITAKILSSAGMEPILFHDDEDSVHDFVTDWTEAVLALQRD